MSLANQTCWVVGGVGVIGRGITRGLLKAGATVIVNSRSESRLEKLNSDLGKPERLVIAHGSLLPGKAEKTVLNTLGGTSILNHVVAHGAVRWWSGPQKNSGTVDETYSLNIQSNQNILHMNLEDFSIGSTQLASLHFSAAQALIPRLQSMKGSTYTFCTGDGSGHPGGRQSAMTDINSHHVMGLASALRNQLSQPDPYSETISCREVRVGLPINRSEEERQLEPRERPLSQDIGTLCAGLAASPTDKEGENGALLKIESQNTLDELLSKYLAVNDDYVKSMPEHWEDCGKV